MCTNFLPPSGCYCVHTHTQTEIGVLCFTSKRERGRAMFYALHPKEKESDVVLLYPLMCVMCVCERGRERKRERERFSPCCASCRSERGKSLSR
ncbi:hypothetical protein KP509_08G006000 [Ceratopteris richardii]|uniref:Uncharacterized protein n=1 Tax=Ceratopteris richardii TaxID=49495 RepID=A0A8T2UBE1_CERRI|nr:hypothetical protein KP509_08G006000 [Ceratopteris richardii]